MVLGHIYVAFLAAVLLGEILAGGVLLLVGYRWGAFTAVEARSQNSPKWKAYLTALLPPACLAFAFLFDAALSRAATEAFMALGCPAVVGTCFTYNRRRLTGA